MFGFGKKKMSAYKYAINTVSISLTMKQHFATYWNQLREKANLEQLKEGDPELVMFFDIYNQFCNQIKAHHKLSNTAEIGMYGGICKLMYTDLFMTLPTEEKNRPSKEEFDINEYFEQTKERFYAFQELAQIMPNSSIFLVLVMFFCRKKDIDTMNSDVKDFMKELSLLFQASHQEGWSVIVNSKEVPELDEESKMYFVDTAEEWGLTTTGF